MTLLRADARSIPLADNTVDLICTSPPYYQLRDYGVCGQIGLETSHDLFLIELATVMRECIRILRPTGSIFVNLGDQYNNGSLLGSPWRFALMCIDRLGLTLAAEIIWAKPTTTPEIARKRVKRIHEHWFHFALSPNYYSGIDHLREFPGDFMNRDIGREPTSVWIVGRRKSESKELGSHFASYPLDLPLAVIRGWCPIGYCPICSQIRQPVVHKNGSRKTSSTTNKWRAHSDSYIKGTDAVRNLTEKKVVNYQCSCVIGEDNVPAAPAVVFDPFVGTGTTLLAAKILGRIGIGTDLNPEYIAIARQRLDRTQPQDQQTKLFLQSEL